MQAHGLAISALCLLSTWHATALSHAGLIQDAINRAEPGDVVEISAGIYSETIQLKAGISLIGAGADQTIIDAGGAELAVAGARNALIQGFTIRNAAQGFHSGGYFAGVFECVFEQFSGSAIRVENGTAIVAHNTISGDQKATGILILGANPLITGNYILNNAIGARIVGPQIPAFEQNVFSGNGVALLVGEGSQVALGHNIWDSNRENVRGASLSTSDVVRALTESDHVVRTGDTAAYRRLMDEVYCKAIEAHPIVVYDLQAKPGEFGVYTRFPWATFSVWSYATSTAIRVYDAYDRLTDSSLAAEARRTLSGQPGISVDNPELQEKAFDRYALEHIYVDDSSYRADDSAREFYRETNLTRREILLPDGFIATDVNLSVDMEVRNGRQVLRMSDCGHSSVRVRMIHGNPDGAPAPAVVP